MRSERNQAASGRDAGDRPPRVGGAAVVVGASMAGLCAARVLAPRFDQVVVIDRDELPDQPRWRSRVPQGRHPHLLLVAGARLLEKWFPGIAGELAAQGADAVDLCGDFHWYQAGGAARRPASPLRGPACSRPLLEWTVRRRVEGLRNVTIRDATTASGVDVDPVDRRVQAVRLEDGTALACDLLVDASGQQARSLDWLSALGYPAPRTAVVDVDMRYVSRTYRRADEPARDWRAAAVVGDPASKRLAMALPMEGDRWIVSLSGLNGEVPPTDPGGMLAFARSLGSPAIADLIAGSEPVSEPVTYRFRASQRRHVEKLRRFPTGWVLLGDAVCSFDPIYGQGMTSAAQQAQALGTSLDRTGTVNHAAARRYFRAASRIVASPWSIAVGGNFAYPGTTGPKPAGTDLFNRYFERVMVAWQHDDAVVVRVNEVLALLRRPEALLTPAFLLRVLLSARRGPAAVPDPTRDGAGRDAMSP
jgi:2-polyprenyl-6-methoxyphenol hydroxylase-like FAD-dependent oxidoreductase